MSAVEVYTTSYCPYCVRAKALLEHKNVKFTEINVDQAPQLRAKMRERANGGNSVPQIFINEQHIGGCDDIMLLERQGRLDALLAH